MNYWQQLKNDLAEELNAVIPGQNLLASDIVLPSESSLADLCWPSFGVASQFKQSPAELASNIVKSLPPSERFAVSAIGAYVNFRLSNTELALLANKATADSEALGSWLDGQGKEVMIEYSNINTHKEYHLGHLRNIAFGDSIQRLYNAAGWTVWPVSYTNDFGINVAKTIWYWPQLESQVPEGADKGYWLGQAYTKAVTALDNNPKGNEEVGSIMREIETREGSNFELWAKTRQWSINYFASVYRLLGVEFKEYYYESDYIDEGRRLVNELLDKGILRLSEGAVIADLEQYGLGVLVVLRSDGTATYPVADLALAFEKFKRHTLTKSLYIVDNRQTLYFKQLFKILELAGYQAQMVHLSYDFVKLPSGMMSSRLGNTITFQELYIRLKTKLVDESRERHATWSDKQIDEVASNLVISVLKFEMLKSGSDKVIVFDEQEALRFDGCTAVYLQYAAARAASILRKTEMSSEALLPTGDNERPLELAMLRYQEVLKLALSHHDPSEVVKYLFELSQLFNDYYHNTPILNGEADKLQTRLQLVERFRRVLANGLNILGIETMDRI
ncbi:arginine--tRNA ligase [Candidatus Falkowbacteria bacterium CG10_big_fil_rev_8_21_14_0_10_37_14]|uniref:Arginine--tRNA ligase n=1 Tax=Candidatus Falkowbacteria bacterium CG10_big_fil_rev_8_21_14_0_10_37_14 TaxID=1974561 RepID=A0A2M6WSR9_9BACT|nr:arginine--tRNA ligase [Candidatus Falkowbacteria bacterium]PIT95849.1 MAG: arginine--tRNA ligase [Candidatus Falkowbacteria bacterium CG10_big_fil_rev_8_21_14_0_10_37_14]